MNKQSVLQHKKVVVIGASSGIGLAVAQAAASEGAKVIIASANENRIQQALQSLPKNCEAFTLDVTNEQALQKFFQQLGVFDHLVYTAGENIALSELQATQLQQAKDYFVIRYWGAVAAVKSASLYIAANGSITLTSGIASQRPGKAWWLGAGICAATEGFAKAMSVELAPVRVNIISPGIVRTNLWNSMDEAGRQAMYEATAKSLPVQRVGEATDIAQAYLYCMKQEYGTGQIITVDGGAMRV